MLDMDQALELAVDFIAGFEGFEAEAYPDPASPLGKWLRAVKGRTLADPERPAALSGKPWTVGYGSTHGVKEGDKVTKAEGKHRLSLDLQSAVNELRYRIDDVMETLTAHQAAALFSFVFNLGSGDHKERGKGMPKEWTIWKELRAKHYDQVPMQFPKFVNAGGVKMAGLVRRRAAEGVLWATEEPGSVPDDLPSSVTREIDTPPTAVDPVSTGKSTHVWTMGLGAAAGIPVLIKNAAENITAAVSPYAHQAPALDTVVSYCGMAAAAAAVAGLAWAALGKQWDRN